MNPTEAMKAEALRLGFTTVGVAPATQPPHWEAYREWVAAGMHGSMGYLEEHTPLKKDPSLLLPGVRSVIAVTLNYNQPNPPRPGFPRIARYALGRDYHNVIRSMLRKLASWVEDEVPGSKTRPCVDSTPIMERDFASQAGLGWYGKNTCLIDSKRGSWFFIGLLLTTVDFEPDQPTTGGCGTCTKCIDACPTDAIVHRDGRWQVDARACISYLTIESKGEVGEEIGEWTFGCDVCQEVCPFNQPRESQPLRASETEVADFKAMRPWPNLVHLAQIGEAEWDELTRGSAVRRAGLAGLQRNARANQSGP